MQKTHKILTQIQNLDLDELRRLSHEIQLLITTREAEQQPPARQRVEERRRGGVSYCLEYTRCGKCKKCANGPAHGPYWYAYWNEEGKTKSKYIGKTLRDEQTTGQCTECPRPTVEGSFLCKRCLQKL